MINVAYGLKLNGNVTEGNAVDLSGSLDCKEGFKISGTLICGAGSSPIDDYAGPYTVTPTQSTQVLNTQNLRATQNITVNPIPSNYGLIEWNGSYMTVS